MATGLTGGTRGSGLIGQTSPSTLHHSQADRSPCPLADGTVQHAVAAHEKMECDSVVFWRTDCSSFSASHAASATLWPGEVTDAASAFHDMTERQQAQAKPGWKILRLDGVQTVRRLQEQQAPLAKRRPARFAVTPPWLRCRSWPRRPSPGWRPEKVSEAGRWKPRGQANQCGRHARYHGKMIEGVQRRQDECIGRAPGGGASAMNVLQNLPGLATVAGLATTLKKEKQCLRMLLIFRDVRDDFMSQFDAACANADELAPVIKDYSVWMNTRALFPFLPRAWTGSNWLRSAGESRLCCSAVTPSQAPSGASMRTFPEKLTPLQGQSVANSLQGFDFEAVLVALREACKITIFH